MDDQRRTKQELIAENLVLQQKIQALEQREEKFRKAFHTNQDSISINRLSDGMYVEFNEGHTKLMGYTEAEIVGRTTLEMDVWEDLANRDQFMEEIWRSGQVENFEARFRRKDGSIFTGLISVSAINIDNVPHGLYVTKDITERKRAEEALRKSDAKQRAMIANIADVIAIIDQDGINRYKSPNIERWFGWKPEEVVGISTWENVHPDDLKRLRKLFRGLLNEPNGTRTAECRYRRKDGSFKWIELTAVNLLHEPDIAGILLNYHDITERKQVEAEQERSRAFIENVEDACFEMDLAGNMTFFNEPFFRIMGYTYEEYMALSLLDRHPTREEARRIFEIYNNVHRTGIPIKSAEYKCLRKDGAIIIFEVSVSLIRDKTGNPVGFRGIGRDITARKHVEEMIKESEERYRIVVENAIEAINIAQDGMHKYVNPEAEKLWGYSKEELTSRPLTHFIHPDDRKMVLERHLDRHSGVEVPSKYSFRILHSSGGTRWVELKAVLVEWNRKPAVLNFLSDITERRQAEEALRESEEKYRGILESIEEGYYELDLAGNITFVNSAMSNHLRYSKDELIGMNYRKLTHEATAKKNATLFNNLYRTGEPIKVLDIEYLRKDGTAGFNEISSSLIRGTEGKPIGFRTLAWDITARRRAEEELRENKAQLDLALRSARIGAWHLDILTNKRYFDEQVCHLLGIDPATFNGTPEEFFDVVHSDDRDMIREALARTIEQNAMFSMEYRVVWSDRSIHYISARGNLVHNDADRPVRINGVSWDITERRQAEEERQGLQERLQRAEKMEALGTLAGGVAHDLNNVLGIIVGYAEMLLLDEEKSSPRRPSLVHIQNGGQRAATIVQDLLTLTRRGVSNRKVLNLNQIIVDCRKSPEFKNLSTYHPSVKISSDLEPDLLNISGSSVHLGKTLFNLISNASEAMPNGGIVTIKTANQYLDKPIRGYDEVREGDYVVLSVSDTGEGIPAADLKRIFEPFYTKKVMGRSGTGLGLAVVWGTVKDHNGYINVQSEEGKGSVFTLYFPVTREDITAEAAAISMSEYMGNGESILIVDDIRGQRDLAVSMLRKLNYNVSSVSSGEEAITYLKDRQTYLLVLDMIMDPGMDGLDTYKKVLEIHPQQKAIIVSGYSESERVHAAQVLGAGAYVRKPYVLEKLGLAVRKELDRK